MNKILLIDGSSILFRAYYGTAYNNANILRNSKGQAVNAVLTFHNMLMRYIDMAKPDYLFVAFDSGKKTRRHEEYSEYKAGRVKQPDDLRSQFPIVFEMLNEMGIHNYFQDGLEADDLIATFSHNNYNDNKIIIISSDKDLYQLVNKNVSIWAPIKGSELKIIDDSNFNFLNGYTPEQTTSLKGLLGDPSDNLPGVKGVGEKTALKLLEQYKSFEGIYEHIDEIEGKLKEKLINGKPVGEMCKRLASLLIDEKLHFGLDEIKFQGISNEKAHEFFKVYELWQLAKRYE